MDKVPAAFTPIVIRAFSITVNICAIPCARRRPGSRPQAPRERRTSARRWATTSGPSCVPARWRKPHCGDQFECVGIEEVLGHVEQAQPLGARTRALGAGQHEVKDVLGGIADIAAGDEPLDALDVPCAVGLSDRLLRPAPTSEPASGSVSTMVAAQPRSRPLPPTAAAARCPPRPAHGPSPVPAPRRILPTDWRTAISR